MCHHTKQCRPSITAVIQGRLVDQSTNRQKRRRSTLLSHSICRKVRHVLNQRQEPVLLLNS